MGNNRVLTLPVCRNQKFRRNKLHVVYPTASEIPKYLWKVPQQVIFSRDSFITFNLPRNRARTREHKLLAMKL